MKFYLKGLTILFTLLCCSCTCDDSVIDTFLLSDFEKSLIPFDNYQDLFYVNENGEQVRATTQPRTIQIEKESRGAERCGYWEVETITNFINFSQNGFSIQLNMETSNDITSFDINYGIQNSDNSENEYFETLRNPSDEQIVNINVNGFEFENVYVFNNSFLNENNTIELILYSSEGRGIELISFENGNYLKLE
ncbi:hypothetical protein MED134_14652 [Dokdonia sp. MED134]|uniref:hypothetical protein n=1 Tax=Dokdonia sp. MED134 TaxID=313590 RepID=UPI000068A816|nr:hypothetical protein [Dokdonia sp. MED134]EAQ37677.1 hypothetical protein MED134_14652 [Dokdonia sp. MED134]